jgi:predicted small integral membrane protein
MNIPFLLWVFGYALLVAGYFCWRWKEKAWNIPVVAFMVAAGAQGFLWLMRYSMALTYVALAVCLVGGIGFSIAGRSKPAQKNAS